MTDRSLTDRFGASDTDWNSETGEIKYQIGEGSSIDQLLGQWHADLLGLGDILDPAQVECALAAMMQNHYKPTMRTFANPWRIFSLNDETGSVICDYPEGSKKPNSKKRFGCAFNIFQNKKDAFQSILFVCAFTRCCIFSICAVST